LFYSLTFFGTADTAFLFQNRLAPVVAVRTRIASNGATFAIASDLGHFSPQYGTVISVLIGSGTSRMRESSSHFELRLIFRASKAVPSDACAEGETQTV
jgi:hypothetical protein